MWTKLTVVLILAMAIMAIPTGSAMAATGAGGEYVDDTSANFQSLNPAAQEAARIMGYGNRPGFQSPDSHVTCYLNMGSYQAAGALDCQLQDVPILNQPGK